MNSASRLPQPGTSAWNRLNPKAKKKAHDLRRALAGVIELHLSGKWDRATLAATGLRDYRAVIGHAITPGHFWRLFDQVIERDGGRHQFDNLALYLPGRLARQAKPAVAFTTAARDLPNLKAAVLNIADNTRPTQPELLLVWDCACNDYQHLLDTGYTDLRARRAVLAGLDASGLPLALTPAALRRTFCRRLDRWIAGGCTPSAIQDQRLVKRPGPLPLSDEEQKHLLGHAVVGGLSKAWRDCIRLGKISPKTAAQFITNPASKSYVPNRIRAALGPTIKMIQPHHLGPHHARMEGAHISSDPTSLRPGDIFSSDDVTNDLYWWQSDPSGKKATKRGQVLLTIDFRTGLILAFALLEEQYTGSDIRGMVATMNKGYGLPRLYMKFEPGVWKKARVIAGSKHEIPGMETELGLREYMDIRYTLPGRPTGKSMVERTIGLIQQRLKQEVGYCGPNEMRIRYESLHRLRLDVDAGRVDPEGRLYSKEQWLERLAEICEEHNQERQDGKYLRGRSPRQAWDEWYDHSDPLTQLSGPALWLLQNHRRPIKVQPNGILITHRKVDHWFRNEITGALIGRLVQTYYNLDDLSSIVIKPTNDPREAYVIPSEVVIPTGTASAEQSQAANASVEAQNRPARTLYKTIAPHIPQNGPERFRRQIVSPEFAEDQADIAAQQEAIRQQQSQTRRTQRKINRLERSHGVTPHSAVSDERRLAGLQLLQESNQDANA